MQVPRFSQMEPAEKKRRVRQVALSILLPPILLFVLSTFTWIVARAYSDGAFQFQFPLCLLLGFSFLLREFKIIAVLFCWAYFLPMYVFTMWVYLVFGSFVFFP